MSKQKKGELFTIVQVRIPERLARVIYNEADERNECLSTLCRQFIEAGIKAEGIAVE